MHKNSFNHFKGILIARPFIKINKATTSTTYILMYVPSGLLRMQRTVSSKTIGPRDLLKLSKEDRGKYC